MYCSSKKVYKIYCLIPCGFIKCIVWFCVILKRLSFYNYTDLKSKLYDISWAIVYITRQVTNNAQSQEHDSHFKGYK